MTLRYPEAPTHVLLHGFTGSPKSFDRSLAEFSDREARFYRPMLAGHGRQSARSITWDSEIERLLSDLRSRLNKPVHLIGYSLGGRVAYGLLGRAPELFHRATLIGAHPGLKDESARTLRRQNDEKWIELLRVGGLEAFIDAWEDLPIFANQSPAMQQTQRTIRQGHEAEGLAHSLKVMGLHAMPPTNLTELRMRIECWVGELDEKHRALSMAACEALPRGTVRIIEGAGHNVLIERPELLTQLLRADSTEPIRQGTAERDQRRC